MSHQFTEEQQAIIHHPLGKHARVLAVAGSGKTTTMVGRVRYLVEEKQQNPKNIRVVMFNKLARVDFQRQLNEELPDAKQPRVLTFHALAFSMRQEAQKQGLMNQYRELWVGDKEEKALICMHRAIDSLNREGMLQEEGVDPKEALDTVGLWKASLIPPERAGHRTSFDLPLIYRRFEHLREQAGALTFDDFVPKALEFMASNTIYRANFANRLDYLIVDEYQDINYGQQELIKLVAGTRADVMVVGDDDQTIYEWRGARPDYILKKFKEDFANKDVMEYTLSHSFRFGPALAQCAHNVITLNTERAPKLLIAHLVAKETGVTILVDDREQSTDPVQEMAEHVIDLVLRQGVVAEEIGVLGRTFTQLEGLQAVFIGHHIPFRVLGMGPFFERDENRTLIDYIRVAHAWDWPVTALRPWRATVIEDDNEEPAQARVTRGGGHGQRFNDEAYGEATRALQAIANTPSRRIARTATEMVIKVAAQRGLTIGQAVKQLIDDRLSPLTVENREKAQELVDFLLRIRERLAQTPPASAGEILKWIVDCLDYRRHFEQYYGEGQASIDRITSVDNFVNFADGTGLESIPFVEFLGKLDTTRGLDKKNVIVMTTVHRTKGLEYEYVFVPSCVEGYMPVHIVDNVGIYDTAGIVPDQPLSPPIESERRLFYVAVTRAKKGLYIGTIVAPARGLQKDSSSPLPSRFLEEMRPVQTQALMTTIQESLAAPTITTALLQVTLRKYPYSHSLLRSVAENYLASDEASPLLACLQQAIEETVDTRFNYSIDYPSIDKPRKAKEEHPDAPTWAQPESVHPWANIGMTL